MVKDNYDIKKGAVKDDKDKVRMDLLPMDVITSLSRTYTEGAAKYEDRNWENGWRYGRAYAALLRHLTLWWCGEDNDPIHPHGHHLDAVIFNAIALRAFTLRGVGEDDRPKSPGLKVPEMYTDPKLNPLYKEKENCGKPLPPSVYYVDDIKLGTIIRDRKTGQLGIITNKYPASSTVFMIYRDLKNNISTIAIAYKDIEILKYSELPNRDDFTIGRTVICYKNEGQFVFTGEIVAFSDINKNHRSYYIREDKKYGGTEHTVIYSNNNKAFIDYTILPTGE